MTRIEMLADMDAKLKALAMELMESDDDDIALLVLQAKGALDAVTVKVADAGLGKVEAPSP